MYQGLKGEIFDIILGYQLLLWGDFGLASFIQSVVFKMSLALKTVAFIAGKSENPADQKKFIHFFIDNLIANISLYALSWPKLNFGFYLTFEIIF